MRLPLAAAALGLVALGAGAAVAHWQRGAGEPSAALPPAPGGPEVTQAPRPVPPEASSTPPVRGGADADEPDGTSPSASAGKPPPADVPASGAGTFAGADSSGEPVGAGQLRRYRVEVEDGAGIAAPRAAAEIEQIIAHPQSWAAHGRGRFQLVPAGAKADFVIRIATPKTADGLCRAEGLDTGGELNCETSDGVVVNLRRWLLGSPTFTGQPSEYRHLIINHEVGHEIGIRKHLGCPGPGRPAPVMMQQIKGLKGCVANAWPYGSDGSYITGPAIP
ncbi:DUF3152 domain-containing protein [Streptomyces sp. NPDC059176]|uniref:DUF3152 domain-containing protein n=1 Tax=unclassified Streptomyces TaxID=2593676 RepID=UPI0036B554A7